MTLPEARTLWAFRGVIMAGIFELFHDGNTSFGFQLKGPDETVVAVSGRFPDKASALEGIRAVRECAGMGLSTDLCPPGLNETTPREPRPSMVSSGDPGTVYPSGEELPRYGQNSTGVG